MVALIQRFVAAAVLSLFTVGVTGVNDPININTEGSAVVIESMDTAPLAPSTTAHVSAQAVPEVVITPKMRRQQKAEAEYGRQMRNKRIPNSGYWDRVAQCETGSNWRDKGKFAGGLGIYIGTWKAFGGLEFAKSPQFATKTQQMVVANRIATTGYQTKNSYHTLDDKMNNKPLFQHPVGYYGWGCIKNTVGKPQKKDFIKHKSKTK